MIASYKHSSLLGFVVTDEVKKFLNKIENQINGAFAPVLHLLSDDVLCGLGLEILNKICDGLSSASNRFDIGEVTVAKTPSKGVENVAFEDKDDGDVKSNE